MSADRNRGSATMLDDTSMSHKVTRNRYRESIAYKADTMSKSIRQNIPNDSLTNTVDESSMKFDESNITADTARQLMQNRRL